MQKNPSEYFIKPDWPAPAAIHAYSTTRLGGVSTPPYNEFNLGLSRNDKRENVLENRRLLKKRLNLPSEPAWLHQVHGNTVVTADKPKQTGDASYSDQSEQICIVQTADCLPVLLTNLQGSEIAAIHAGWRGLAAGIINNTIAQFKAPRDHLLAWLGPAITQPCYEVGSEVYDAFMNYEPLCKCAFQLSHGNKYLLDLYEAARIQLNQAGVSQIYGGNHCTYTEDNLFFSYRRDQQTGNLASLIWIK